MFENTHGRNDRFSYAKVREGGAYFFVKHAETADARQSIVYELDWEEFMVHVAAVTVGRYQPIGEIEQVDATTIKMPFVELPHLASGEAVGETWRRELGRYADMLAALDAAAEGWTGAHIREQPRAEHFETVWRGWLGDNKDRVARYDEAVMLVKEALPYLETRMQHGDLKPDQIFIEDDTWVIYDGEKSGTDLLRYNDLAYAYGRLATTYHDRDAARQLLHEFIVRSGFDVQVFGRAFIPVMTSRTIGMYADAFRDEVTNQYIEEAKMLLDDCLENSLERLL